MEVVFVAAVFFTFLAGLEASPSVAMSYTRSLGDGGFSYFQMRCRLSASTTDTEGAWQQGLSRVDIQKQQYKSNPWVSVNNESALNEPVPTERTKLDEYNCTASSSSPVNCEVKITITNLKPIDAGIYRCQYVPDPSNMNITWESGWALVSVASKPDDVDLVLIDTGKPDDPPNYDVISGGVKVYELDGTTNQENLTVKCSGNGTFGNPKSIRIYSGGQRLPGTTFTHITYSGKLGFTTEDIVQSVTVWNDNHPVSSLVGKDVECVAEGSESKDDITSSIIVRERSPPLITCAVPKASGQVGATVDMKCVVYGVIPGDDIWWQVKQPSGQPSLKLRHGETNSRFKMEQTKVAEQTAYEVLMKISSVIDEDFSTASDEKYKLYATNKYGTQSATLSLSDSKGSSSASHLHISRLFWCVVILLVAVRDVFV